MQQQVVAALVCLAVLVGAVVGALAYTSAGSPAAGHHQAFNLAPPVTSTPATAAVIPSAPVTPTSSPAIPRPSPAATPRLLVATPKPAPTSSTATQVTFTGGLSAPQGGQGRVSVATTPGVDCTLTLSYQGAPGQLTATADGAGRASWRWSVAETAPIGNWPIQATCGTSSASAQFQITAE